MIDALEFKEIAEEHSRLNIVHYIIRRTITKVHEIGLIRSIDGEWAFIPSLSIYLGVEELEQITDFVSKLQETE